MPPSSGPRRILRISGSWSPWGEVLGGRTLAVPPSRQLRRWPGQAVYLLGSYRRWQLPLRTTYVPWENSSSCAIYKDPWCQYQSATSPPARKTKAQKHIGNVQSISDSKRCDRKWQLIIHLYLLKYPYREPVKWLGEWRHLPPRLTTWIWSLGSTRWKERTNSYRLSSDLLSWAVGSYVCTYALTKEKHNLDDIWGSGDTVQWLRVLVALLEGQSYFPNTHPDRPTATCRSSSRESNSFFCPPQAQADTQRDTWLNNKMTIFENR